MGKLNFKLPLNGAPPITSPYGIREWFFDDHCEEGEMRNPFQTFLRFHNGNDYKVAAGTPVMASERGTVIRAKKHQSYGKLVIIDHAPDAGTSKPHIYTLYAHLSDYGHCISPGMEVIQGQEIAKSGNTGRSTGAHLHFAIIESSKALEWHVSGSTNVTPTEELFKKPESFFGVPKTLEGTQLTKEEKEIKKEQTAMVTRIFRKDLDFRLEFPNLKGRSILLGKRPSSPNKYNCVMGVYHKGKRLGELSSRCKEIEVDLSYDTDSMEYDIKGVE